MSWGCPCPPAPDTHAWARAPRRPARSRPPLTVVLPLPLPGPLSSPPLCLAQGLGQGLGRRESPVQPSDLSTGGRGSVVKCCPVVLPGRARLGPGGGIGGALGGAGEHTRPEAPDGERS